MARTGERYAVVIEGTDQARYVLVPSGDRPFCEDVAARFNDHRSDGLRAIVAPHLLVASSADGA